MLEGADPGGPESNNHFAWKYENNSTADSVCSSVSVLHVCQVYNRKCSRVRNIEASVKIDVSRLTCPKLHYGFSLA